LQKTEACVLQRKRDAVLKNKFTSGVAGSIGLKNKKQLYNASAKD
jgi:hypothetical protein